MPFTFPKSAGQRFAEKMIREGLAKQTQTVERLRAENRAQVAELRKQHVENARREAERLYRPSNGIT